jgi:RimJ/RimL family protein N-acetyltransferase
MTQTPQPVVFRKGKKVILRPVEKKDAVYMYEYINDPEVNHYLGRSNPLTFTEEEEWIINGTKATHESVIFAIEVINGPFIGTMGLHNINWINQTAVTGTCIGSKEYQGRGYGTDAKMLLLDFAFNTLGLRKICSGAFASNVKSIGFNKRCGYKIEGKLKKQFYRDGIYHDEVLLAVFRKDWLPLWKKYISEE